METYFIYSFIIYGIIQGLGAQQLPSVALIYPQRSDVTVDAATDLTLGCRGTEAMSWKFNDAVNDPYLNSSQKNIINIYNAKEIDYKHESILTVYNVSAVNVGFYYCHGTKVNFDTPRRSNKIYVFVNDHNHLTVNTSKIDTANPWYIYVPCRPTAQDINITLTCEFSGVRAEMSVNPGNYSVVQKFQNYVRSFHPYHGFTLGLEIKSWLPDHCECVFKRNNQMSTIRLLPNLKTILQYEHEYNEGPDSADVGGHMKLKCLFLLDHSFPYHKYLPYWEFLITGSPHEEHLQVIQLKQQVLLINTLTMHNISTEDDRHHRCRLDGSLKFYSTSRYVYVNDKKSNHSAPRIYSPTGGEIEINAGINMTLSCAGSRPVTWTGPKLSRFQLEHVTNLNGLYDTYLHLTNVSYSDTGLYYCLENSSLTNHQYTSDTIYMYVSDGQNLHVPYEAVESAYPYTNVTVPCLPTSRDVNVSLSSMLYQTVDHNTLRLF